MISAACGGRAGPENIITSDYKACAECITNIAIPSIIKLNLILRNTCKVSAQQSIEQPISLLQKLWKSIVNLTWKKSMTKVDFYIPTNDSV